MSADSTVDKPRTLKIDANSGGKENNPMCDHANGEDIHPYSISIFYLIGF